MRVLVTCPPMLGMKDQFVPMLREAGVDVYCPEVTQTLSEERLVELVPQFDGWIIGDDPATRAVFEAGRNGSLRAAVKWGAGVDNVDFEACRQLEIPISNTPNMFGDEVSDLAVHYLIGLARETFFIDRSVRQGEWPKNRGISLAGRTVGVVGYGDIGRKTAVKMSALGLRVIVYDPGITSLDQKFEWRQWPGCIEECDFIAFTCALNSANRYMFSSEVMDLCSDGVRVVNVARGGLINEADLIRALKSRKVHSVALDVFENEPLSLNSYFIGHPLSILGSHNASNTTDAVVRTNDAAISQLLGYLNRDVTL